MRVIGVVHAQARCPVSFATMINVPNAKHRRCWLLLTSFCRLWGVVLVCNGGKEYGEQLALRINAQFRVDVFAMNTDCAGRNTQ